MACHFIMTLSLLWISTCWGRDGCNPMKNAQIEECMISNSTSSIPAISIEVLPQPHFQNHNMKAFLSTSKTKHLRLTILQTARKFLYLHPAAEEDTDAFQLQSRGVLEPGITALWQGLVQQACEKELGTLIVDVGVNFGYYTTLSSQLGCEVIGFEPVSTYQEIALYNVAMINSPPKKVNIFKAAVSSTEGVVKICMPEFTGSRTNRYPVRTTL